MNKVTIAALAVLTLSGCAASSGVELVEAPRAEAPTIPPLPADLAVPCEDPGVAVGQDARAALADNRVALKTCIDRHGRTVRFYEDVRQSTRAGAVAQRGR